MPASNTLDGEPAIALPVQAGGDVTVVIVNYRTPEHVASCLAALARERAAWPRFDVMVVDGGSGDASPALIAQEIADRGYDGWVTLLPLATNGGFGWANNQAIRRLARRDTPSRFVHLLNPDAIIEPGAIRLLFEALDAAPDLGSAGSLLLSEDGEVRGSAFHFPSIRSELVRGASVRGLARLLRAPTLVQSDRPVDADWLTGASVMIRLDALRQVGLFDEGFFLYFEEVELMHRLHRAGWRALHVPTSRVRHIGGAATGIADGASAQKRLPSYWFESRRRYFALTGGRTRAWLASLAWLGGQLAEQGRSILGRSYRGSYAPHEASDLVRHGLRASRRDATPAAPRWDSAVDRNPAWMVRY